MADLKISQLSAATALAGTEVVPVVQSGSTKKATIDQILTPAAGKGVDFSANAGAAGATSELLDWYEEGTWTPVGNGITLSSSSGFYTRIGRLVTFSANVTFPATSDGNPAFFTGLPFTVNASAAANGNGTIGSSTYASPMTGRVLQGFDRWYNFAVGGALLTNANLSGVSIEFGGAYIV